MSVPSTTSPQVTVDALFGALDALDVDGIEALFASEPQGVDERSGGWRRGRESLPQYLAMVRESGMSDLRSAISDVHVVDWGETALATLWRVTCAAAATGHAPTAAGSRAPGRRS
jgi:hypothetical protein